MFSVDTFSTTIWLLISAAILFTWYVFRRPRGLPPGPLVRLPLLGYAPFLKGDILGGFRLLRKKYGDIFHVYLGPKLAIVLNGYDVIRDALVKNADHFTDRPPISGMEEFGFGIGIIRSSGDAWKEHRRFALGALREFGFGKNILQEKIREEITFFLKVVEEEKNQPFDIATPLHTAVSNVICNIVFGERFQYDDARFHRYLESLNYLVKVFSSQNLGLLSSFLSRLPGDLGGKQKALGHLKVIKDDLIEKAIQEHMKNFSPDNINNFMDAYIKEMKERSEKNANTAITMGQLWRVIFDLFAAGSETTATSIRWALVYLQHDLDLQERLYREILEKVGTGRLPVLEDRAQLPLLDAFLLEVQRHGNIVPLSLPHSVSSDVIYQGYVIPKGCIIIPNLDSVLKDPKVWKDPDVFRPDRFLQDGRVVKPEEFIPFSAGRRLCLGEALARMELFLIMSAMIQRFRWEAPEGGPLPETTGIMGTICMPKPYRVRAILRQ